MSQRTLERVQFIPRPRSEVFAFFSDATNLERITPPFLRFRIVTPTPIDIREGALLDYRLRLFGIPFAWRTRIDVFEPDRRFIDTQLRGPYKLWRHLHEFAEVDGGTRMLDRVDYDVPLGPLGDLARSLFVTRTVERIFDFRARTIEELLGAQEPRPDASAVLAQNMRSEIAKTV